MKEIIRNKNKKIIIGGLIALGICSLAFITKPTYKAINNDNLDKEKMAVYIKNETGNYEKSNIIPTSGYILDEGKSTCNNNAIPSWNYKTNTLKIKNLTKENTSCYLYFDTATEEVSTVLGNLTVNKYTPDFSQVATTDEGIFKAKDNDGISCYWRGAATTNYLKFGGYCWRIIRINGDGTIRLIYDGTTCHQNGEATADSIAVQNVAYNVTADRSEYVGWTYVEGKQRPEAGDTAIDSNAKTQTEIWYNEHLASYDNKIAEGNFCNDREVQSGSIWSAVDLAFYYAGYDRFGLKHDSELAPILECLSSDIYILKIGSITTDEILLAGSKWKEENNSYYLYNEQNYWTMTPSYWSGFMPYVFRFGADGGFCANGYDSVNYSYGIRPVINLRSDITISQGEGTLNNPYIAA